MTTELETTNTEPAADPKKAALEELTAAAAKVAERVARRQSDLRDDVERVLKAIDRELLQRHERTGILWAIGTTAETSLDQSFGSYGCYDIEITKSAAPDAAERLLEFANEQVTRSKQRHADALKEISKLAFKAANGGKFDDELEQLRMRLVEVAAAWRPAPVVSDDVPF